MSQKSKKALVTGASRGIGLEIARKLLSEDIQVIGTARSTPFPEDLNPNPGFRGLHVDLANEEDVSNELKPLFDTDTPPQILVNNAGLFQEADFESTDEEWLAVWDLTQQVNLRSAALMCKWFINTHRKKDSEAILINIASRAAYRGDTQEYAAYAASKAGMVALTKSIARNLSSKGIIAYAIAPGFVETDMARESVEVYGEEYLTQGLAFDQITPPGQVAALVSFLAKGEVTHMAGTTFHINGGSYLI